MDNFGSATGFGGNNDICHPFCNG
jgi:hypothetical protein